MIKNLSLALCLNILGGCASCFISQTETGTNRITKVEIYTLFDAHNDVSKLRTTFTEKSQGVSLGSVSENSSGTNFVKSLEILKDIVVAMPK